MDDMTTEEKPIVKASMLSTTVALFLIPAYVYLCSFLFEKGMCDFYGISQDFIKPDLTTNLILFISLVSIVVIIYLAPHFYAAMFREKIDKKPALSPFLRNNTILIISFASGISLSIVIIDWWRTFFFFLVAFVITNTMALIQYVYLKEQLKSRSYDEIATDWNDKVSLKLPFFDTPDVLNFNLLLTGAKYYKNLILLLIGLAFLSYYTGRKTAHTKRNYDLSTNKKGFVLLKIYGDDMILKNYNFQNRRLGDSVILAKKGDSNFQMFVRMNIGQLIYKP